MSPLFGSSGAAALDFSSLGKHSSALRGQLRRSERFVSFEAFFATMPSNLTVTISIVNENLGPVAVHP